VINLPSGFIKEFSDKVRNGVNLEVYSNYMSIIRTESSGLSADASEVLVRLSGYDADALKVSGANIADELLKFESMAN
jgi:hypothetical protein